MIHLILPNHHLSLFEPANLLIKPILLLIMLLARILCQIFLVDCEHILCGVCCHSGM